MVAAATIREDELMIRGCAQRLEYTTNVSYLKKRFQWGHEKNKTSYNVVSTITNMTQALSRLAETATKKIQVVQTA